MASNVKPDEVEGDMLSMIDVVFLLLIFFLVGAKIIPPQSELVSHLPQDMGESAGTPPPDMEPQRVELRIAEYAVVNGKNVAKRISVEMGETVFGEYELPVFQDDAGTKKQLVAERERIFAELQAVLTENEASRDPSVRCPTFLAPQLRVPYDDVIQALDCIVGANITEITFAGKVSDLPKLRKEDGIEE